MDMEGLSTICAGLGSIEEDEDGNQIGYTKGEYCLDNLKDLLRFLRRDDPHLREVFKQVCKWNIVAKDLIPIIEYSHDDRNLVLNAVKILVFLTMPLEALSKDVNEQLDYLWGLKRAITYSSTIAVIVSLLEKPLENLECDAFTDDDWKLVQLVLTLFRNILAVRDISIQQKAEMSVSHFLTLRENFLELLFHENVMDLIIVLTQHVGDHGGYLRQDNLLLLEIFHYIFVDQDPELVAKACMKDSKGDRDANACVESLRSLMKQEEEKKKLIRFRHLGRHSQFSGTFTCFTMDGSKTLYKRMPMSTCDTQLKPHKVRCGPGKIFVGEHGRPPTTKTILELLHDFLNQFLSGGYNVLMQSIHEDIEKEHHAIQISDVVVFFQVAQFVMSFQYHKCLMTKPNVEVDRSDSPSFKGDISGPIAASMNDSMFELVIEKWRYAFEGLKETKNYKFLSAAGSLLRIMIQMLDLVLKTMPEDHRETHTAHVLLYKLFYDQTDQGLTQSLFNLIKSFDTLKQPKSDLADLVEMIHVVVELMENLQAHGTLRVSRKARKRRKKNKMTDRVNNTFGDQVTTENNTVNETVGDKVASEEFQIFDHEGCAESADIATHEKNVRISGSVEKDESHSMSVSVDMPQASGFEEDNGQNNLPQIDSRDLNHNSDDIIHGYGEGDSSGDEQLPLTYEVDFKITTLFTSLGSNSVINNVCWLLKFYKSNSTSTNQYVVNILRRICEDLNLSPMLYQLSHLCTFYNILDEQKSYPCQEYELIVNFLTSLVRRMLRKMKNQPLLFVEVLFSKTRRDCHFINVESMKLDLGAMKKEFRNWRYDLEDRDTDLSRGIDNIRRSMADALGEDEYDLAISHELDDEKDEDPEVEAKNNLHASYSSVDKSNEGCNSISDGWNHGSGKYNIGGLSTKDDSEGVMKRKRRLILSDELEEKVRGLFEKYKESRYCSRRIAEALDLDQNVSPTQVSNICRKLGLKAPSRKRMYHADKLSFDSNDQNKVPVRENDAILPDAHNLEETSLLRRPSHIRKRVCAFDENQEQVIRDLFEQFKDHKKCSHMIANALNPDGLVTATQVARKLKQLGLHTCQWKKKEPSMLIRDEDFHDGSADGEQGFDNQILSSLKRSKKKRNVKLINKTSDLNVEGESTVQDSNDELLNSVLQNVTFINKEAFDLNVRGESTANNSDDDLLSSILQKSGITQLMRKKKLTINSIQRPIHINDSEYGIARGSSERDHKEQPIEPQADNDVALTADIPRNSLDHEATGIINVEKKGLPIIQDIEFTKLVENDELEDSGDDVAVKVSPKHLASRRKLRMILDPEDDE
ncbi:hypothetical protein Nepgr_010771 [Nepenthes gracilis]|uniref:Timeless N-terminal domain-containing protein n=1 Tax=Nepenthes gracilis TaxID=150966 RepID=A0AAD3SDT8_NEPGR|nr:hypothetical protein Nepgr_010771 [Nepenthes gracilis]